jgi:hypothetical protein
MTEHYLLLTVAFLFSVARAQHPQGILATLPV